MMKPLEVAALKPVAVNVNVCAPTPSIRRSVNVTTPRTAFTVLVPSSAPVPLAIATVTAAVDVVTRLLLASRT